MERGVRQGAASSVLLFIAYMDGLFQHLEEMCSLEAFIGNIHTLIHTDDTIILSMDRLKFIYECNELVNFFDLNGLKLNLGTSAYLIINLKENESKKSIVLKSGALVYKSTIEYLGVYVCVCVCVLFGFCYAVSQVKKYSTIFSLRFIDSITNFPKCLTID